VAQPAAAQQSIYCPNCDRLVTIPAGGRICPACGRPFAAEHRADLPRNLGRLVERSGLMTLITGGIALVICGILGAALRPLASPGSWVERLLYPVGGLWQVPWATMLVFIWGVVFLLFRLRLIKAERLAPQLPFSKQIADDLRAKNVEHAGQQLQQVSQRRPIGLYLHRVLRAVTEWQRTRDGAAVHRALSDQAALDVDTLQSSINIVRVFVWSAPILGFIGTVLGISMGVDKFSTSLMGGAGAPGGQVDMSVVQPALVKVANSLAFAFNTTLLGLLAALILMIVYTWIQRIEDDLLDRVYDAVNERIVSVLVVEAKKEPGPEVPVKVVGGLSKEEMEVARQVAEAVQEAVTGLATRADELEREAKLLDGAAASLRVLVGQNQQAWSNLSSALQTLDSQAQNQTAVIDRVNAAAAAWPQQLQAAAETIGASLQTQREYIAGDLDALGKRLDERTAQQEQALEQIGALAGQWPQQLQATRETMAATFQTDRAELMGQLKDENTRVLGEVTAVLNASSADRAELIDQLKAENGRLLGEVSATLDQGTQRWSDSIKVFGEQVAGRVAEAITASSKELQEELRRDQVELADSVTTSLSEVNQRVTQQITGAVGELRQTVGRVDDSLRNLQTPFELRLVPRAGTPEAAGSSE